MSVITKTGDRGTTSLFNRQRVLKSDTRVVTYGLVDLLNSQIGLLLSQPCPLPCGAEEAGRLVPALDRMLSLLALKVQPELFNVGAMLATPRGSEEYGKIPKVTAAAVEEIEALTREGEGLLPPMRHFVMPRGHLMTANAHVARATCRHVETAVVDFLAAERLLEDEDFLAMLSYLNRLGDFLFIVARVSSNIESFDTEAPWIPRKPVR